MQKMIWNDKEGRGGGKRGYSSNSIQELPMHYRFALSILYWPDLDTEILSENKREYVAHIYNALTCIFIIEHTINPFLVEWHQ